MAQNGYAVRGPLDFTITDAKLDTGNRQPKLTVKARFEKGPTEPVPPAPDVVAERAAARGDSEDLPTVASLFDDDLATVSDLPYAWATVALTEPDGHRSLVTLTAPTFTVGRSRSVGNDLVLTADGKVSKRHARIERNAAGRPLIYDLASTNGTTVNDVRIFDSSILQSSDKIGIGDTILVFEMIADPAAPGGSSRSARKRAVLAPMNGGAERVLASDNLIGRGITCDIVLDDAASANRQARIVSHEGGNYTIEDLSGQKSTLLNERTIHPAERLKLSHGDRVQFGITLFQFLEKNP
jgi:pSer/pThr/pTyr-binding forkhead associated (FHA) protein